MGSSFNDPRGMPNTARGSSMSLTDDLSGKFFVEVTEAANAIGCPPQGALQVMFSESSIKANVVNSAGFAGIAQMGAPALRGAGFSGTPQDFAQLSAEGQMPFVATMWKNLARGA